MTSVFAEDIRVEITTDQNVTLDLLFLPEPQALSLQPGTQTFNFEIIQPQVPDLNFLQSDHLVDWNSKEVQKTFAHLQGTDKEIIVQAIQYIQENVEYDLTSIAAEGSQKVSWVLQNNKGVCDEITATLIAAARLQSSTVKGLDLIPMLCTQQWKFTYDVEFPLMVQVVDDTGYRFNFASTVNLYRNEPDKSQQDLRPQNVVKSDYEKEYCEESLMRYDVFYSTESVVENNLTGVFYTEPLEGVNITYTCLKYSCDVGSTVYDYGQRGDIAGTEFNTPACTNAVIRGKKEGYIEDFTFQEINDEETVRLELKPLKNIESSSIEVYTHVVSPKDCEQGVCFTIGEALPYNGEVMVTAKYYDYDRVDQGLFSTTDSVE